MAASQPMSRSADVVHPQVMDRFRRFFFSSSIQKLSEYNLGIFRIFEYHSDTDMEFVQKFTPPDFKVINFTLSISPNFNS